MKNSARIVLIFLIAPLVVIFLPRTAQADDSAASIAAGGLVPRRETRIAMAKEVLRISDEKVVVDYDFRNDSDQDVTTEVAFPVPPYRSDIEAPAVSLQSFSDFKLSVDGKPIAFQTEAKATLNGKDVTGILVAAKIDVASFGHYEFLSGSAAMGRIADLERLPKTEQQRLSKLGLFDLNLPVSTWTVHLQYHWTQTFAAHSTVHIRHEYSPVIGDSYMEAGALDFALHPGVPESDVNQSGRGSGSDVMTSFCLEPQLARRLIRENPNPDERFMFSHWIDFILTTANTWERPIEDFTLILERPHTGEGEQTVLSFCSPGTVEKLDANHFRVHLTNFVPSAELHIGFFPLHAEASGQPAVRK